MNTRQELLNAIRRDRADDLPRLAFADYLQENGEDFRREVYIRRSIDSPNSPVNVDGIMTIPTGAGPTEWNRGFLEELECSWDYWSRHAAAILPEHPGLERVVLTTAPTPGDIRAIGGVTTQLRGHPMILPDDHPDSAPDWPPMKFLKRMWGGDPTNGGWGVTFELPRERVRGRYVLSIGDTVYADEEGRAVPINVRPRPDPMGRVIAIRPNQMVSIRLIDDWGNLTPREAEVEIGFLPDQPDAHGGQYRHWEFGMRSRELPEHRLAENLIRNMAEQFARDDAEATERILRDLLTEHGITEDDLRTGRREVARLTTTDGRPPRVMMCACQTQVSLRTIDEEVSPEQMTLQTIQLRDRSWRVGGAPDWTRYRVADGMCPRCQRMYFAVTREERR